MARFKREFTDGDATRSVDVGSGGVADVPACRLQQPIDIPPCLLFRLWCQNASLFCYLPNLRTTSEVFDWSALWLFSVVCSNLDASTGVNLQQLGCIQQARVQGIERFGAVVAGNGQVQRIAGPQLGSKVLDVGFG